MRVNPEDYGQLCAVATEGQRDLRRCAASYPRLFPERLFGSTMFSTIAFAIAFSAPGLPAGRLRVTNRAGLWNFAADVLVETGCVNVSELVRVAGGGAPGCDASRFLTEIRDDLAAAPGFAELGGAWCAEIGRMLDAMVREREWTTRPPTFDEYLPVAAGSIGFSFVFLSHWIATGENFAHADAVIEAGRQVEPALRLINDLGTYDRDRLDGDVNALRLGVTREDLTARLGELLTGLDLGPVRRTHPALAEFLDRQIGFNLGFYRSGDYRAAG